MSTELNTEIVTPTDNTGDNYLVENPDGIATEKTERKTESVPTEASQLTTDTRKETIGTVDEPVIRSNAVDPNKETEEKQESTSKNAAEKGEVIEELVENEGPEVSREGSLGVEYFASMVKTDEDLTLGDIFQREEVERTEEGFKDRRLTPDITVTNYPRRPEDSVDEDVASQFTFRSGKNLSESERSSEEAASLRISDREEAEIDRSLYYELHELYTKKLRQVKTKNHYYQVRVADYYLRRRMFHVLMTDKKSLDENQRKYEKILDELEVKLESSAREQSSLENEIENLKYKHHLRKDELETLFARLQKEEFDFSKELVNAKEEDGKLNAEKLVERYLKRQKNVINNLSNMRLTYIKLVNKLNENQELLDSLDNLGPDLHLIDYEQLKSDNRNLQDKLEEKESQLTTIRKKCQNTMQISAHYREKVTDVEMTTAQYRERLEEVTSDCIDAREQVTTYKVERDRLRVLINKLKEGVGLLGKPKLLQDMKKSLKEVEATKLQIENYKDSLRSASRMIAVIKKQRAFVPPSATSSEVLLADGRNSIPKKLSYTSAAS